MNKKSANRLLHRRSQHRLKPVYAAVLLAFAVQTAEANPIGGTVTNGSAGFATSGNTLTVTNTPGTIINWQGFSIGSNEITNFAQQSASSTVLNRVVGNDPSNILGTLRSNGRVFLVNPNGILFGAGAVVDVAGLVASTLNLSNADFIAGHHHYTQVPGAGNISNAGSITAQDNGHIYLIAPNVENTGVITAPNGEILLAAGHSVDLVNTNDPNLRVNITAPAGDTTNVGKLIASSGSLGLFGTVVRNGGMVNADSATMQGGKIVFKASQRVEAGGTIAANGTSGGSVDISAAHSADPNTPGVVIQTGVIHAQGTAGAGGAVSLSGDSILSAAAISVDGAAAGGQISVQAANRALSTSSAQNTANSTLGAGGDILVSANVSNYTSGSYSATGATGGNITLAGNEIKLAGAQLDASGINSGGTIHVGGLMHGASGFAAQGVALTNSTNVLANNSTSFKADGGIHFPSGGGLGWGNGGEVVLWSDQSLVFAGNISAQGGLIGGNGGMAEVSGLTSMGYYGLTNLSAPAGLNGTLLLDPKNITIVSGNGALTSGAGAPSVLELIDPNIGAGEGFGGNMTELANGNIVLASPNDSFGGTSAGAVYMYSSAGTLLSTLTGTTANDNVGIGGITQLAINDNFVVVSPNWGAGVSNINPLGAVTWGSATTGVSGSVSSANSVVGSLANDQIGRGYSGSPVVALSNGNYVVASSFWNGAAGAATWVDGTTGQVSDYATNGNTNIISSANSLVGGTPGDYVGYKVIALSGNGNYVVGGATAATTPTATWVNGTNGQTQDTLNTISVNNSLMGASDPYALTNGNYAVASGYYAGGGSQRGVVTWVNGTNGLTSDGLNVISAANSIIGQSNNDMVGQNGVIALPNGNYVIANFGWSSNTGAVTWVNGSTGATSNASNVISSANSVIGNSTGEQVGARVVVLTNGNYVIGSFNWRGPEAGYRTSTGAATWVNGTTGLTSDGSGQISQFNSVLGFNTYDEVGYNITALSNGNYVVGSPFWSGNQGAVTWGNGATGTITSSVGFVSATNSLVGSLASDYVGASSYMGGNSVVALPNGNYVVGSAYWNSHSGAVTWGNGATAGPRTVGTISSANSIVGVAGQYLGYATILSNGNYVVGNSSWNGGMGAATWVDGNTGQVSDYAANGNTNIVSATNSLVGSVAGDYVGGVGALSNGNYVVLSSNWDNGAVVDAGAATWVNGTTGRVSDYLANGNKNIISAANSLVGSTTSDQVGNGGITELGNNNYAVNSSLWNNGALTAAGAVTWANSSGTTVGAVSVSNSLVGSTANENLGAYVVALKGTANLGSAYVGSSNANAGAGRAFILGATVGGQPATGTLFTDTPATDVTIGAGNIADTLNLGTSVVLQANNDITQNVGAGITATGLGNLTLQAGRSVTLSDVIHIGGTLNITANDAGISAADKAAIAANRSVGAAVLDTSLATITAKQVALSNSGGDILAGAITATGSGAGAIKMESGGNISITSALTNTTGGSVILRADMNGTSIGTINFGTSGSVALSGGGRADLYYNPVSYTDAVTKSDSLTNPYSANMGSTPYTAWMLVNDVGLETGGTLGLQAMNTNLAGNYALGANIDASATSLWNPDGLGGYYGFVPIGAGYPGTAFSGQFDGLGNTISSLYIYRPAENYVGLFGYANGGSISNVGLVNANVTGGANYVGGLVGLNSGTISNSSVSGNVTGGSGGYDAGTGGLVGTNYGTIDNSSASGSVNGTHYVGGLVGYNGGTISNSNASNNVTGNTAVGGLAGYSYGTIINSYVSSGTVNGYNFYVGGLVGQNTGVLTNSHYNINAVSINDGTVVTLGGLYDDNPSNGAVGQFSDWLTHGLTLNIANYASLSGSGNNYTINSVQGMKDLLGFADNAAYTFTLAANIDLGNTGLYIPYLAADFNGNNLTISNLNIYQPFSDNLGLFGNIASGSTVNNVVLTNANVTGNSNVGALAGWNQGTISNSRVDNSNAYGGYVSGSSNVGGLVGKNTGTINNSYYDNTAAYGGSVSGNSNVGGLVGYNSAVTTYNNSVATSTGGIISNSYVSNGTVSGGTDVGGLVGYSRKGSITGSYANGGSVTGIVGSFGGNRIGGLVGYNNSTIDFGSVYGGVQVKGVNSVGGLVGYNDGGEGGGVITNSSFSDGMVTGNTDVGGLVGYMNYSSTYFGKVGGIISSNSFVSNAKVTASGNDAGGLVGYNAGTISGSYVSGGSVTGSGTSSNDIGGLVGNNAGDVSGSYVNGSTVISAVSDGSGNGGGLVGYNSGTISNSYASNGSVSASSTANPWHLGGLVGENAGSISNTYVSGGTVSGNSSVGGLVGYNNAGSISNSYASTGALSGGTVGGLVGNNAGTVSASFWDTTVATGVTFGIGNDAGSGGSDIGATGLTSTGMMTMSNFTGWSIANTGEAGMTWRIYEGYTAPLLTSFLTPLSLDATNVTRTYDGHTVSGDPGATYTPNIANPVLLGAWAGNSQGARNAGSYTIDASGLYSDQLGYDISYTNGNLTINPLALTGAAIGASSSNYASALTPGAVSFTNIVGTDIVTDTASVNTSTLSSSGKPIVGTYTQTASGTLGGTDAGNYSFAGFTSAANYTINKLALGISGITAANKVYDSTTAATVSTAGATYTGLFSGDAVTVNASGVFSDKNVANGKTVMLTSNYTGADTGNYTITGQASTTANITPATLTVTADYISKIQNASDPLLTYMVSGLRGGDTATATLNGTLSRDPGEAIGAYQINQGTLGLASANYTMTYAGATFSILAPITVTDLSVFLSGIEPPQDKKNKPKPGDDLIVLDTSNTGNPELQSLPMCRP